MYLFLKQLEKYKNNKEENLCARLLFNIFTFRNR